MMKQIIALLIIGLMLNTSIVFAGLYSDFGNSVQSTVDETYSSFKSTYDEYLQGQGRAIDLGEAIIVNVKGYEPSPIPQSSVENQELPVFVYLTGTTFGSIATYVTGEAQPDVATGISNIPPIKDIDISIDEKSQKYLASYPKYIAPVQGEYSLNNLGQIIVILKRFEPTEKEVKVSTAKKAKPESNKTKIESNLSNIKEKKSESNKTKKTSQPEETGPEYELKIPDSIDLNFTAKIYFDLEKGGLFDISQQNLILKAYKDERAWLDLPDSAKGRVFADRGYIRPVKVTGNSAQFVIYDKNFHIIPALSGYLAPGARGTDLATNSIVTLGEGQESNPIRIGSSGDLFMDSFILKLNKIIEPTDKAEVKVSVNGQDYTRTLIKDSPVYPGSKWKVESISVQGVKYYERNDFIKYTQSKSLSIPEQDIPAAIYVRENLITLSNGYNSFTLTNIQATTDPEGKRGIFTIRPLTSEEAEILESIYCPDSPDIKQTSSCLAVNSFKEIINKYPSHEKLPEAYYNLAEIYSNNLIKPLEGVNEKQRYPTDMKNLAYYYYSKVLEFESDKKEDAVQEMEKLTQTFSSTAFLEDEGTYLEVLRVIPTAQQDLGTAKIETKTIASGFSKDYKVGDPIEEYEGQSIVGTLSGKQFKWQITKIGLTSITLVRTDDKTKEQTLSINSQTTLAKGNCQMVYPSTTIGYNNINRQEEKCDDSIKVKLVNTEVPVELDVSAIPGTGKAYSTSNFKVHLLIDKRPFELSPDQLRSQIKKTEELIKKLDAIITKLTHLVTEWKKTCLVVSTYLMIKSAFLTGNARNEARKTIMPIYQEQCNKELAEQGSYTTSQSKFRSLSGCYIQKSDEIEKNLDSAEEAIKNADTRFSGAKKKDATGDDAATYNKFIAAGGTDDEFKNYLRYDELEKTNPDIKRNIQTNMDKIGLQKKIYAFDFSDIAAKKMMGLNPKTTDIKNFNADQEKKYKELFNMALINYNSPASSENPNIQTLAYVQTDPLSATDSTLKDVAVGEGSSLIVSDISGVKTGTPMKLIQTSRYYYTYYNLVNSNQPIQDRAACVNTLDQTKITECITKNTNYLAESAGVSGGKVTSTLQDWKTEGATDSNGRPIFIENKPEIIINFKNAMPGSDTNKVQFYSSTTQEFAEGLQIRTSYAEQNAKTNIIQAQYTLDGSAYCYPLGDLKVTIGEGTIVTAGDYALVLDWYKSGAPSVVQIWNVGPDGKIDCGKGDDQIKASQDALNANPRSKDIIFRKIPVGKCNKPGEKMGPISAGGKTMYVSCNEDIAGANQQNAQPQCTDVMDPGDCKILFNVCDPVMCPTSRCNLGGRYTVDNVMASGIIGSVVLCWPNKQDGIIVPVCLTGILAGLTNIKTILDGYKTCLTAALEKHENIGMCDYIRSVGVCELAWKELMFIVGAKGGVLDWAMGKLSPNRGGGEYLSFRQSFEQMSKSFNYFTTEYSESLLAQYKARSTQEIGTEICRMAVAGKFPNLGEVLNEMSQPEEPPQFMAVFDESPSVTQSGVDKYGRPSEGQSIYRGFYHIYAGKAYTGDLLKASGMSDSIQYSVYLRNTKDTSVPVMYVTRVSKDQLGRAAYMKRGTYAQESINVMGQTGYNQICVVINGKTYCGFGKTSSAFSVGALQDQLVVDESKRNIQTAADCNPSYSRTSPSLGSITMPEQFGILNSGIVRICNPVSPGPTDRWVVVGDCGNDKNGKYLGKCWIDRNSISINDAMYANIVGQDIEKKAKEMTGYTGDLLTDDVARPKLNELNDLRLKLIKQMQDTPICTPASETPTIGGEPTTTPTATPSTPEISTDTSTLKKIDCFKDQINDYFCNKCDGIAHLPHEKLIQAQINKENLIDLFIFSKNYPIKIDTLMGDKKKYNGVYGNNEDLDFIVCDLDNPSANKALISIGKDGKATGSIPEDLMHSNLLIRLVTPSGNPDKPYNEIAAAYLKKPSTEPVTSTSNVQSGATPSTTPTTTPSTPQSNNNCETDETTWINSFTAFKNQVKVTINGADKDLGYAEFIKMAISSDLIAQALFQQGGFYMKVAERRANEWKNVQFVTTQEIGPAATTYDTRRDNVNNNLILNLDPNKYYVITILSGSQVVSFNSVKYTDTYFKEKGFFKISFTDLKDQNIDPKNIDPINIKTYDTIIDLDDNNPSNIENINKAQIRDFVTETEPSGATKGTSQKTGVGVGTCTSNPQQIRNQAQQQQYIDIINSAAETYNIEPEFIMAIITTESSWNPSAIGTSGELGLMQFMPGTAKTYGLCDNDQCSGNDYRSDPKKSIFAGARYIAVLMGEANKYSSWRDKSKEKQLETIAVGYNAGSEKIKSFEENGDDKIRSSTTAYYKNVMACYNSLKGARQEETQVSLSKEEVEFSFVVLSDIHEDESSQLDNILSSIYKIKPEYIILNGDLIDENCKVNNCYQFYYNKIKDVAIKLNAKLIAIPGNHDYKEFYSYNKESIPSSGIFSESVNFPDGKTKLVFLDYKYPIITTGINLGDKVFIFSHLPFVSNNNYAHKTDSTKLNKDIKNKLRSLNGNCVLIGGHQHIYESREDPTTGCLAVIDGVAGGDHSQSRKDYSGEHQNYASYTLVQIYHGGFRVCPIKQGETIITPNYKLNEAECTIISETKLETKKPSITYTECSDCGGSMYDSNICDKNECEIEISEQISKTCKYYTEWGIPKCAEVKSTAEPATPEPVITAATPDQIVIQLEPVKYEGKNYYYVAFDKDSINLKVLDYGGVFENLPGKFGTATVQQYYDKLIENRKNPTLIINGGYFSGSHPEGILIEERKVINTINKYATKYKNGVLFVKNNQIYISSNSEYQRDYPNNEGITQAIQGHLLFDITNNYYNKGYDNTPAKRNTIGIDCLDNNKIIFAQTAMDTTELGSIGKFLRDSLKCKRAINLDGGGSTTLKLKWGDIDAYIEHEYQKSESFEGSGRKIANVVAVYMK